MQKATTLCKCLHYFFDFNPSLLQQFTSQQKVINQKELSDLFLNLKNDSQYTTQLFSKILKRCQDKHCHNKLTHRVIVIISEAVSKILNLRLVNYEDWWVHTNGSYKQVRNFKRLWKVSSKQISLFKNNYDPPPTKIYTKNVILFQVLKLLCLNPVLLCQIDKIR